MPDDALDAPVNDEEAIEGLRFSSIKLQAVTAAGGQFGPPGYETDLLYLACLATLVLGGSGPLSIESLLAKRRKGERS